MKDINNMSQEEFVKELGWIFEHSPWIAERAWGAGPFTSAEQLHESMVNVVEHSSLEEKLGLLRAHPDLATRVHMADASVKEQQGVGLDSLGEEEYEEFLSLNDSYKEKFNFPFILAVKGHNKDSIKEAMKTRLNLDKDAELQEALNQIYKIGQFRLEDHVQN
ncbi:2-oxo-4-hydroxy-4-carboxy-5-ureidoimidazoline decarboxylase [Metabacillus fastidiosus]|uniref:2-oxo-4-hydroxy-4-carboxy-5-ureidoimidazoline decarboxylase n=2 Tax=Metabacillus fastidiosus TaxID=1458 RepID=A0ABU6P1W5_9BACI|nr:2-oxo-4-hydroxy-4-carboxy-5-ureidoimidazoline decarboxylase [Metabacillus fastidiosus]MED4403276.1 2-oxo-4-hydroxy-4-carboxy-5-ureidoimidazoline decarboxylase [Metabacillus fastidiosus]